MNAPNAAPQVITETQADAGREVPAAPAAKPASSTAKPAAPGVATPAATTVAKAPAPDKEPVAKDPAPKDGGRFVVQVGAFSDSAAARETRQKVEKLGLKTYTQVAETSQGNRIRVRVGHR